MALHARALRAPPHLKPPPTSRHHKAVSEGTRWDDWLLWHVGKRALALPHALRHGPLRCTPGALLHWVLPGAGVLLPRESRSPGSTEGITVPRHLTSGTAPEVAAACHSALVTTSAPFQPKEKRPRRPRRGGWGGLG